MSLNIICFASEYWEIHPYNAMNIDSVKINTSPDNDEIIVSVLIFLMKKLERCQT